MHSRHVYKLPWTARGMVTSWRTPVAWAKTFPTFIAGVGWIFCTASTTNLPLEKGHFPAERKDNYLLQVCFNMSAGFLFFTFFYSLLASYFQLKQNYIGQNFQLMAQVNLRYAFKFCNEEFLIARNHVFLIW